ncbi:hypothetical protein NQ315_017203 [Exocentrus adspersus]|uniref:Uncharacterized protein n=1 Tax=Exocentrus adspersus TaxID=1586481 RepID=A0AAV8V9Q8_9CUCU|nr:hypothetical protein NQ315_017203 [Exocentrus adspersus]
MSSEPQDYDLIDLHVRSPVLPRASPNFETYTETSDNLIDTELPVLEQKLQTANLVIPVVDSRRTSVDVEDILITIDDDEVDAPVKINTDHFLDLCQSDNLEALDVLRSLDNVLDEENDDEEDIEDCLKDLDNYLRALDSSSGSEECSSNSFDQDKTSSQSSSDDDESLRNKLRQMEENYNKFLASGCLNRAYVDTEIGGRRPSSACEIVAAGDVASRNQPARATVAVVRKERPSIHAVITTSSSESPTICSADDRTSAPGADSDEDIDWSWVQDVARDVTLERRAHAAGDCCTGTVVVEAPRPISRPGSSSEPAMQEEPKDDARGTWLRSSMRRLQHLRLPSTETGGAAEHVPMQTSSSASTAATRPVSAPSRLADSAVRVSRTRSRQSAVVSHEPSGRARSSSASSRSRSRRPRSLSSSDSSLASSVDSTPSCSPAASPTQNGQEQANASTNHR